MFMPPRSKYLFSKSAIWASVCLLYAQEFSLYTHCLQIWSGVRLLLDCYLKLKRLKIIEIGEADKNGGYNCSFSLDRNISLTIVNA